MKRGFGFVAALLIAGAAVVGCGKEESTTISSGGTGGGGAKRTVVIGIVAKSQSNPVFQAAHKGAQDAAAEMASQYNADIKVDIKTPTDEDAIKQVEAIDALIRDGVDGIAVSCTNAATVAPAIDRAIEKGIAVMCFDSDAPQSKRFAYYGTDDASCGQRVMQELAKVMGDKGTVAILGGNQGAPNLTNRIKGVTDELAKHPNMKLLEASGGVFFHPETPEQAAEAVAKATNSNPGIEGWAFIGGWPLFTKDALKWEPGKIKVVSVDALPAQLGYLTSGHVEVLLAQDCYGWGTKSVQILMDKIVNNKTPENPKVIDPLTKVTKENVGEFGKNWDKWLGK
jgi:ribose transport system substrate-binding protein